MTGNIYMCDCGIKTNKGRKCKCSSSSAPSSPVATANENNQKEAIKEANEGSNELSKEQESAPKSIEVAINKVFNKNAANAKLSGSLASKNSTSTMNPLRNKSLLKSANAKLNNKRLNALKQFKGINPLTRRKVNNSNTKATTERIKSFLENNESEKPRVVNKNVVEAQALLAQLRNKSDDAALAAKEAATDLKAAKGKEELAKAKKEKEAADAEAKSAYTQKVNAEQAVRDATINRGSTNANILAAAEKASPKSTVKEYNPVTETKAEKEARLAKQAKETRERALAATEEQMRRLKAARDPAYLAAERSAVSRGAQSKGQVSLTSGGRRTKRRLNKKRYTMKSRNSRRKVCV